MSFAANRAAIVGLLAATRDRDEAAFAAAYSDEAVVRQSGVPESLGGVLRGRTAIVENFRRQDPAVVDVRVMFGDDTHVCVVGKLSGIMTGTEKLLGNNQAFNTYECAVYTLRDRLIEQQLIFVNWLDPYVQVGFVDVGSPTRIVASPPSTSAAIAGSRFTSASSSPPLFMAAAALGPVPIEM